MESSRQKTFKNQKTIQFISAVFVFILPIYPSLFSANQFKLLKAKLLHFLIKNCLAKPPGFAKATIRQAKLAKVIYQVKLGVVASWRETLSLPVYPAQGIGDGFR